jgi:hypothetical protein
LTQIEEAQFVVVDRVPMLPLSSIGLYQFNEFERGDDEGITYLDTYFLKRSPADDEALHFHEMIHIVQWRLLGSEFFSGTATPGWSGLDLVSGRSVNGSQGMGINAPARC